MSDPALPLRAEILSRTLQRIAGRGEPADPVRLELLRRWAAGEVSTDELVRAPER